MNLLIRKAAICLVFMVVSCLCLTAQKINVYDRPVQVERSRDYDAKHYRIELKVDLDKKSFEGKNRITLSPLKSGFQICHLDQEEMEITGVLDKQDHSLRFEQTKQSLAVYFPIAYKAGEEVVFTVLYKGQNPVAGLLFDDESVHHPQMVSSNSWPDNAHHWFPCYDYPNDKVTQEVIVTVKDNLKALSNGRLVSRTLHPEDRTVTYHWSLEQPHATYLSMLAIGPFAVIKDSLGSLPINYWVYPKDSANATWIFANTPRIIDFYGKLFGYPYPWAKYDQVVGARESGGAEATTATILGEGVNHDKRAEQDFSWERIIAHEAAHQWWGDLITLRTWSEAWMNESFATYSDYLYTRAAKGEDEGAFDLTGKRNQYLNEARTRYIRPIVFNRYNNYADNFDSHTYPKGAAVLHMLRFVLGDEGFFRTMALFLQQHAFQPVDTHDYMVAVKEATGQNLDWFFGQFIYKPGHPKFQIADAWDESSHKLKLTIVQIQDTLLGIPIYKIPVIIGLTTSAGKKTEKIWLARKVESFEFALDEKPLMVRFDEGDYLLKEMIHEKNSADLVYQLEHDDMTGRLWAANELGKFANTESVVKVLKDRLTMEPFWAVRKAMLGTLGKSGWKVNIDFLKKMCEDEKSQVRVTALQILANTKDPDLNPFYRKQFEKESSYLVQAEVLRAIAKTGKHSELGFLRKAAKMPSHRDMIQSAAEKAMEEISKTR